MGTAVAVLAKADEVAWLTAAIKVSIQKLPTLCHNFLLYAAEKQEMRVPVRMVQSRHVSGKQGAQPEKT